MRVKNISGGQSYFKIGDVGKNVENNNIAEFPDTPDSIAQAKKLVARGFIVFVSPIGVKLNSYDPFAPKPAPVVITPPPALVVITPPPAPVVITPPPAPAAPPPQKTPESTSTPESEKQLEQAAVEVIQAMVEAKAHPAVPATKAAPSEPNEANFPNEETSTPEGKKILEQSAPAPAPSVPQQPVRPSAPPPPPPPPRPPVSH